MSQPRQKKLEKPRLSGCGKKLIKDHPYIQPEKILKPLEKEEIKHIWARSIIFLYLSHHQAKV